VSGCGCDTRECSCHDPLAGWFLGALTPDQATEEVFPQAQVKSSAGHNQSIRDQILASVQASQITGANPGMIDYIPGTGECSAVSSSAMLKPALLTAGGGFSLKFAPAAFAAGPVVGAAVVAIGALADVFGAISAHHAAAVKKEQSTLCVAVPAANQALQVIDEAVQGGQATPQQGIDALNSLLSGFLSNVASIQHGSDPMSSQCNAACVEATKLHAIVLEKQSEYQDLIAGAAQTVTPARPNTTSPAGTAVPASSYASFYSGSPAPAAAPASTDWFPIAAVFVAGFLLLRNL
jgi:hypothetical protein